LAGQLLTYSFTHASVTAGTVVVIVIGGLTNTATTGTYGEELVTLASGSAIDTAIVPAVTLTSGVLGAPSWSASSTATGATGVTYSYGATAATSSYLSSVVMSVPPGTSGSATVTTATAQTSYAITLASPTATLSGTTLTVAFTSVYIPSGTVLYLQVAGLTNLSAPGSYAAAVTSYNGTTAVDSATTSATTFTSLALTALSWTASSTATGATGVSYSYSFGLSAPATLTSLTMTVPPGTAGTPSVTSASPSGIAGGTVSLVGQLITYSFSSTSIGTATTISLVIGGLTNTATPDVYAATITALHSGSAVASGTTAAVTFTSTSLTGLSWTASSTSTGATGVSYAYAFTTATGENLSSVTMSVPAGTSGTPTVGTVSAYSTGQGTITLASPSASLAGTTLTFSFTSTYVSAGAQISVDLLGLTNTSSAGSYSSSITTKNATTAVDSGTTPALSFDANVLGSPSWTTSSTQTGATGVTYTYSFGVSSSAVMTTVEATVPTGTGGTPSVASVSPSVIAGGTVALSAGLLTYTFTAAAVNAGTTVSIAISGLTNTTTAGSYTAALTALDAGTAVASGSTPSVSFTSTVLTALSWTSSSTATGATGVSYTYSFTTASATALTSVTMSVPTGTAGTPAVGTVSVYQSSEGAITLPGQSASLTGTTLTFSFTSTYIPSGTVFSVAITGLANTSAAGTYTAALATKNGSATVDSGSTGSLTFAVHALLLTAPASLSWSGTLTVSSQALDDANAADQSYAVGDSTGSGDGWNVTVTATTFTNGSHTLPNTGTFSTNGSLTSLGATAAPSITCISSCVTPTNQVVYPVAVTTAPSSPVAAVIYSAAVGTGSGSFTIGGSSAAHPVGWWLDIPPNAFAGTYTSTITFAVGTGP
jgi:hypothetical protein